MMWTGPSDSKVFLFFVLERSGNVEFDCNEVVFGLDHFGLDHLNIMVQI